MKTLFPISVFLLLLFSCVKKVDLDIKQQAKEYVVIFGVMTNTAKTNSVSISVTEDADGSSGTKDANAILKMESAFGTNFFTNKGNGMYVTTSQIMPNAPYRFSCTYNNKTFVYETVTNDELAIDSLYLFKQANGKYRVTVRLKTASVYGYALMQLYTGKVSGPASADTVWQAYNDRFPSASYKIQFLSPFIMSFDEQKASAEVLRDVVPEQNELLKLEVYSLDVWTTQYLLQLEAPDNYVYDPLSLAPPLNYFAFSNQGLGVIVPALVTRKIIET